MIKIAHKVKCFVCGSTFDRDKEECIPIPNKRRYAHKLCYERYSQNIAEEEKNRIALEEYIKQLFNYDIIPKVVYKQIKDYVSENHYTYSGILKTLKYHFEVKGGDLGKAQGRIGIVPYQYENARNYYYTIWENQQRNENKEIENFILPIEEIHITPPKTREPMRKRKRFFTFLEEDMDG